jgi:hypothetical protein
VISVSWSGIAAAHRRRMTREPTTFEEMARGFARAGASPRALRRRARWTRGRSSSLSFARKRSSPERAACASQRDPFAARPSRLVAPFRPLGLRGAVAAGHVALAAGRAVQAELIGAGIAEAAPRSPAGLRLVGEALFAQGKFVLAVRALRGALSAAADDPFTCALHAEALWFAGERTAARAESPPLRASGRAISLASVFESVAASGALDGVGGTRCE